MLSVRSRRLPPGVRRVVLVVILALCAPGRASAFDGLSVLYGLREYGEYNDNLLFREQGTIRGTSINTAPDLSLLYDDGKTRWLARGTYRRESFPDEQDLSGDYYSFSGEFSRELGGRTTFSVLGGYQWASSVLLGQTIAEPGQSDVVRPGRGRFTRSTFWSPSIETYWSRRFKTALVYDDNQSFVSQGTNQLSRSFTLAGIYAVSPATSGRLVLQGSANKFTGVPFAFERNTNVFTARVGFNRVFTPRLTMDFSAGPQWTQQVNQPDRVTLIRNVKVTKVDPVFGTTEQVFLREPGLKVENLSTSLALGLDVNYVLDANTTVSLSVARSSASGTGFAGTFEQDQVSLSLYRQLNRRWRLALPIFFVRQKSIATDLAVLPTTDPLTGEREALDRTSFDLKQNLNLRQWAFQPRLDFQMNRWWTAFLGWDHQDYDEQGFAPTHFQVNRVILGVEFRNEERL